MKTKLLSVAILSLVALTACKKELDMNEPGNLVPKTVDQDPSLPSITVNNTMLHSETFGDPDDPMVVVIHGGPGVDYRGLLNCKDLTNDGYFVVFYDQRGTGLSMRHDKSVYTIQIMREDLSAVIQHYRRSASQKVFLFGHSWGAMLATDYVNNYPNAIAGLVLAEPGGFNWDDTKEYVQRLRDFEITSEGTSDLFYSDQFITGKEDQHEILDYKFALMAAIDGAPGNVLGNAGQSPFWRYGAILNKSTGDLAERDGFDFTANLSLYQTKVLFFYSELNRAYGLSHAQKVSSAYQQVQLEMVGGAGHEMIYFGWQNMYSRTLNYLNSLR